MLDSFFKKAIKNNAFLNFVDGVWSESSDKETFQILNIFNAKHLYTVQNSTPNDIVKAVNSAINGFSLTSKLLAKEKSEVLLECASLLTKHSKDFVNMLALEAGKPIVWAEGEVKASIEYLTETATEVLNIKSEELESKHSNTKAIIVHKPFGVVALITPFNYPLFSVVSKFASSFAANNSSVVKPASDTPICALMFARIVQESGAPINSINVVVGKSSKIGDSLVSNNSVSMINFTGSSNAGEAVVKSGGVKNYLLELGGKGAAIVLEDADLDLAASECVKGCFKQSGQRCDAVSRVLIVESVADSFVKKVLDLVKDLKFGDPLAKDVTIGPLINQSSVERVDSLVKDAINKGAKILIGGKYTMQVYEPTVLDKVSLNCRIAWEETFGPVMPIIRVKNKDEAVSINNKSEFGLDSCIFTKNENRALDVSLLLDDGTTTINACPSHGFGEFPFGGNKKSGIGREGVRDSIYAMMTKKVIKIVEK